VYELCHLTWSKWSRC